MLLVADCPLLGYAPLAAELEPLGLVPAISCEGWLPGVAGLVLVLGLFSFAAEPVGLAAVSPVADCPVELWLCEFIAVSLPAGGGVVEPDGGGVVLVPLVPVAPLAPAPGPDVQVLEIIFTLVTLKLFDAGEAPALALAPTPPALAPTLPLAPLCEVPVVPVVPAVVPAVPPVVPAWPLMPAEAPAPDALPFI